MSLSMQNQVRHMYIGLDYPGHADVSAVKAGANGDLALLSADGTAPAAGKKFYFLKKNNKGTILSSDIINPKQILYTRSKAYVAPVQGKATISDFVVDANTLYTVEVVISQFGSLSRENEYLKKAFYKSKVGDDAESIVDGLVKSLARNFSREEPKLNTTFAYTDKNSVVTQEQDNAYFKFEKTGTGATAALVITEKTDWADNSFSAEKRARTHMDFRVNVSATTVPTIVNVASNGGVGSGKSVAEMEYYLKGERNDFYRGAGYPHNFDNEYDADVNGTYDFIEIGYFEEGRDEAKKSKKQLTLALSTDLRVKSNTMITTLNTILGAGSIEALA